MTNHNNEIVYCIECGCMVMLEHSPYGIVHEFDLQTEYGIEWEWCEFPYGYATCPPPELEIDWDKHLVEPEPEFIEISNESVWDFVV